LPSSLKTIEAGAFSNNQIHSVIIPNGVTEIDNFDQSSNYSLFHGAFANNPITTIVIPTSLANGNIGTESSTSRGYSGSFGQKDRNIITRISIPARMNEDTIKGIFEEAFFNFWINQDRAGGTYIKRGPIWSKE